MARYGMLVDSYKCCGCYNCFLACRDEFCGNENPGYAVAQPKEGQYWIKVLEKERGKYPKVKLNYIPVLCMHCDNAPCVKAAKNGAIYRRPDGIVMIDPVKAKGQKQLVSSCPYRVIEWNEEKQLPQKCIFCAHMLDKGEKEPRCVEVCPTGALLFGDLDDPKSNISKAIASCKTEPFHSEFVIKEKVVYTNLPKKFVAGTVIYGNNNECAEGVTVTLSGKNVECKTTTNIFGDFEFEGLPENKEYTVKIKTPKYKPQELKVKTVTDAYLGVLVLKK